MADIIPNQGVAPVQQHYLPPPPPAGAAIVGEGGAPIQQVAAPVNAPIPESNSSVGSSGMDFLGSINWLEIVVYASVLTLVFIGVSYYRNQNNQTSAELQKQSDRISVLESDISTMAAHTN